MNNPFTAAWSCNGNLLCHGHWIIRFQTQDFLLPEAFQEKHLGTLGIYSVIDPEDELYKEGLDEDDWILAMSIGWLIVSKKIRCLSKSVISDFFSRRLTHKTSDVPAVR